MLFAGSWSAISRSMSIIVPRRDHEVGFLGERRRVQRSVELRPGLNPKYSTMTAASGKLRATQSGWWASLPKLTARPPSSLHTEGSTDAASRRHSSPALDRSHRVACTVCTEPRTRSRSDWSTSGGFAVEVGLAELDPGKDAKIAKLVPRPQDALQVARYIQRRWCQDSVRCD
jgi:hypothetical protein